MNNELTTETSEQTFKRVTGEKQREDLLKFFTLKIETQYPGKGERAAQIVRQHCDGMAFWNYAGDTIVNAVNCTAVLRTLAAKFPQLALDMKSLAQA